MKKIVIFGSGCHAKIVFSEILKLKGYKILGFVDDFAPKKKIVVKYVITSANVMRLTP